jgi:hypothetical protein
VLSACSFLSVNIKLACKALSFESYCMSDAKPRRLIEHRVDGEWTGRAISLVQFGIPH